MSRLQIEHSTVYSYRRPVKLGRHRLVLRPREGHDLRVESMSLDIAPAHQLLWSRDVFNNSVAIVEFLEEADRLEIRNTAIVDRARPFPTPMPRDLWNVPMPIAYDPIELTIAAAYLAPSYAEDAADVDRWLSQMPEIVSAAEATVLLTQLCALIPKQIKYQRRMVKGVQTPAQTLALGSGSCRDMATLMMEGARRLGLAARFASGYLDCPASEAGRAAMHAWTEVYLPILGWHGFDPTLGEPASLKHIAVGVSHHPRGVMPISGMFSGAAGDYLEMTASVKIDKLPEKSGDAAAAALN